MIYHRFFIAALLMIPLINAQDTPSHVIVTYKVYPNKRATFKATLNVTTGRFTRWRDEGSITSYQILESSLADDEGWETTAIIETGLRGLELAKRFNQPDSAEIASTTTVPVDLIERATSPDETSTAGVYLLIPYELLVSTDEYRAFVRGSLVPQLTASLKEGGLLGYEIFTARFPGGRSWNSLVVLHYRDWIALGQRKDNDQARKSPVVRQKVAVIAESIAAK